MQQRMTCTISVAVLVSRHLVDLNCNLTSENKRIPINLHLTWERINLASAIRKLLRRIKPIETNFCKITARATHTASIGMEWAHNTCLSKWNKIGVRSSLRWLRPIVSYYSHPLALQTRRTSAKSGKRKQRTCRGRWKNANFVRKDMIKAIKRSVSTHDTYYLPSAYLSETN